MDLLDRRGFLRSLGAGAVVIAGAGTGLSLVSSVSEAAPVPADKNLRDAMEDFAENAQYYYRHDRRHSRRRRRRRRRHCWWHRGVRYCRWRYW